MARTYKRDANGRFASGGGSSSRGPAKVGRSGPRGGKVGTRTEQRRNAKAQAARTAQFQSKATGAGRSARDAYKAAAGAARAAGRGGARNGIRSTGGLPRPVAGNSIKRTTGPRRGPMAVKMNAIRTYRPATPRGLMDQGLRGISKSVRSIKSELPKIRQVRSQLETMRTRMARQSARDIAGRLRKGIDGELSGIALQNQGGRLNRAGADVIRRRAARATAAAARGSKAGAKAAGIYDRQLAFTGPGKPSRKAKNNLKPGPRNTKGTPPKRRRKR